VKALPGICLGFFLVLFDATAVNVATGGIATGLGASLFEVQWVLNAYTVAFAAAMLTAGGLADRWGARRVYLAGLLVFALASAACAAAPTVVVLVVARAVQGIGAAAVVPCSLALITHRFRQSQARTRALGVWGGVSGVGLAAGPAVGGALVAACGWRAVFLVVVPVAAVSMVVVSTRVAETPAHPATGNDIAGQVLAIVALVAVTAALPQTATLGWTNPLPLGLFGVAAVAGGAFLLVERRISEPLLPLALFVSVPFSAAVGVGLLFNFGLYGALFCLALDLERTLHQSALAAGLALLPLTAVTAVAALLSGPLTNRFGPRTAMMVGLGGGLIAAGLLAGIGDHSDPLGLAGLGAILGFVGLAMPAMTGVALASAGARRAARGAAVLNAARQAGGALGVALLGSTALLGGTVRPHLLVPMVIAATGYLTALIVTITAIPPRLS
jgi:DHA2 family methylenomycin A resistance protein-like MFS transporter